MRSKALERDENRLRRAESWERNANSRQRVDDPEQWKRTISMLILRCSGADGGLDRLVLKYAYLLS